MITFKTKEGNTIKQITSAPTPKRVKLAYKSTKLHTKIIGAAITPKTMGQLASELPDAHPKTLGYHVRKLIKLGKLKMHGSPSLKGNNAAIYTAAI